ncbi:DUF5947 family protein [Anaeromyxobacter paludicola]|uniref:Uncharacterized protein n=1 Tax=Anaeromyxobacter paludicola TaxID=2918171 RepID=A0ABN6N7X2_9BACT|nr:DUF5947 family protein [Anaeromyxobacter paludicola]BDG07948.1 hypothetical protein AMPC_10610 [Anaeromyxobacter paludicola]
MLPLRALERFARPAARPRPAAGEACELCAAPVGEAHPHVVDLERRALCCACPTCSRLFVQPGAGARFRTVPDRVRSDPGLALTDADLAALGVPVRLVFFARGGRDGRWFATFPGSAGAVEGALDPAAWAALATRTPLVAAAEPDVEALLAWGERGEPGIALLLVPVSACYALAGLVRRRWRGLDGGPEVWREVADALAALRARARPLRPSERKEPRP